MADTLIRLQGAGCALVGGYYEDHVFISLRTKDSAINAGTLVQRVVGKLGPSGGHGSMSAGRIKMASMSLKEKARIEKTIMTRLKKALKIKERRGEKLIK
jgi:nanoRNase/pAp phosphatase (c-di-AMP/oligoRNAs hydrolase)